MVLTRGMVGSTSPCSQPLPYKYIFKVQNFSKQHQPLESGALKLGTSFASRAKIMKGSSVLADPSRLYSSLPLSNANCHVIPCQSRVHCNVRVAKVMRNLGLEVSHSWPSHASCLLQQRKDNGFVVGCASWGLVTEMERELEAEMNPQEEDDKGKARIGMTRFRHKCGERKGVVELLECLEREAIMGEDLGKEPTDYNRRAQIFDRSSRVFQALKEFNNDVVSQQSP